MPKPRTMKVWPNPFMAHDPEGRPCGVVALEPIGDGVTVFDDRRFVGATLKAVILRKAPSGSAQQNLQDTTFEYADEPTAVPLTPYYVRAIRSAELIAADEASAQKAGVKFEDPAKKLLAARDGMAKHFDEGHDHDGQDDDFLDDFKKFEFGPMKKVSPSPPPEKAEKPAKTDDKPKGGV